jgi:hypothetical protein
MFSPALYFNTDFTLKYMDFPGNDIASLRSSLTQVFDTQYAHRQNIMK